jgi:hypothetical protein
MIFGCSVEIIGQVQRKNQYTPKAAGSVARYMLEVAVMGGLFAVDLKSREALDAAPPEGEVATVKGTLKHNSFGGYDIQAQSVGPAEAAKPQLSGEPKPSGKV